MMGPTQRVPPSPDSLAGGTTCLRFCFGRSGFFAPGPTTRAPSDRDKWGPVFLPPKFGFIRGIPVLSNHGERPMRTRLITAALALVALAAVAQAQPCLPPTPTPDFEKAVIKTTDLGNRTYMLEGVGGTVGGNVTVAVGDDGVIVIDNMFAQMYGKIKAAIAAVTSQPVPLRRQHALQSRPYRRQRSLRQGRRRHRGAREPLARAREWKQERPQLRRDASGVGDRAAERDL